MKPVHKHIARLCCFGLLLFSAEAASGQETVFGLFRDNTRLADDYFAEGSISNALELFMQAEKNGDRSAENKLKIARCFFRLREHSKAVHWYDQYLADQQTLSREDLLLYAEAQAGCRQYESAIQSFRKYLEHAPDDSRIIKKIWQLQNIHYLYEDSIHYALRPIRTNTPNSDLCATPYRGGIVFMSNRESVKVVQQVDGTSNAPFYQLYFANAYEDTVLHSGLQYADPVPFDKAFTSRYHAGPVRFYEGGKKMIYICSSRKPGAFGLRTLQLHFAEKHSDGKWKSTSAFPFNSTDYSISDAAINEQGDVLYFSSDMKGGSGGKDIYRSALVNNRWTKPENLGTHINTPGDEVFPYIHHNNVLYFSSDGHAGMGGLDIFKLNLHEGAFAEPVNVGYPLNTNNDEFGIVMDSLATHGYLTSNRVSGGLNDDIFEFDMDVQTYPLVISGLVKAKQFTWSDSSTLKPFGNARLYLVDNIRNITVHESNSDSIGYFTLRIPYFSKYKIRVIGSDNEEHIVSLEIPKHRKADGKHEIVIVKDPFKQEFNEVLR